MIREIFRAIRSTLVLLVMTAVFYPLLLLAVGQIAFPFQANGSMLRSEQGTVIGSALIGQPFTSDRYFWSRPSTSNYSSAEPAADEAGILQTGVSGASNLAPSNPALLERIRPEIDRLQQAGIQPTADLVYTSGSSLDPHITPTAALNQVQRIAAARGIEAALVERLIAQHTDRRFLGIFGEPGVNVLNLNLALDTL
jgi:K+-transporting ATPase ATPase C chain